MDLIIGPMFSGKSTELLKRIQVYTIAQKKCLLVKPKIDNRYDDNKIVTHDMKMKDAVVTSELSSLDVTDYDIIGIDEGQFFPDIYETTKKWHDSGKIIVIAMLNGTSDRELFDGTAELFAICRNITKLHAVCKKCFSETAIYTYRHKTENKNKIMLGGVNEYSPLCSQCYLSVRMVETTNVNNIT